MRSRMFSLLAFLAVLAACIFMLVSLGHAEGTEPAAPSAAEAGHFVWDLVFKVLELASPAIVAGVTWFSVRIAAVINGHVNNTYAKGALGRLNDAVWTSVKMVEQTMVQQYKEAKADGKLTAQEREHVLRTAVNYAKSFYGVKGLEQLAKILGLQESVLNSMIVSRVEAAVHDVGAMKRLPPIAPMAAQASKPAVGAPAAGPFGPTPGLMPQ